MSANIVLNLWKKNLGAMPGAVWERTNSTTLILSDDKFTAISEQLRQLSDLLTLNLGHNRLAELPKALAA